MRNLKPLSEGERSAVVAALYLARDEYMRLAFQFRDAGQGNARLAAQFELQSETANALAAKLDDAETIAVGR